MRIQSSGRLLADTLSPSLMEDTLAVTLAAARGKRLRRAAGRSTLVLAALMVGALWLVPRQKTSPSPVEFSAQSPTSVEVPAPPSYLAVTTRDAAPPIVIQTTSLPADWTITTGSMEIPRVTEDEVFELAGGKSLGVVNLPDGAKRWILPGNPPPD